MHTAREQVERMESVCVKRTWLEIDLDRLERNLEVLRAHVGPGVRLAPVIKADAYGHGAVAVARELVRLDPAYLCVSCLPEALELRDHGVGFPLLVMGFTPDESLPLAVEWNVTLAVFDFAQAHVLSREARRLGRTASVHIKVNTGFHRLGKEPTDAFAAEIVRMSRLPNLELAGIFTHLRLAGPEANNVQYDRFTAFVNTLASMGVRFEYHHISDSIAAVSYPAFSMDMVRPGAIVYGYVPKYQLGKIDVKPISTFKTTVSQVHCLARGDGIGYGDEFVAPHDMMSATLAVGYADGYPRHLSYKGEVQIRGCRAKMLGIVCMDQMMVDVTHIDGVRPGDEAILFGSAEGAPSVEELAVLAGTNKNDILAGIARRVPRVYYKNGTVVSVVDSLGAKR